MRKYIFLDIDGTLFSTKIGRIPDSTLLALELARKNGHKLFLCTGRSLAEVVKYLNADVDGFILGAGSMVYVEGKRIYDHPMDAYHISRIKHAVRALGLGYSLEGTAGAYCSPEGYESLLQYFGGVENDRAKQVTLCMENCTYPETFGSEENDSIYKICAFGTQWEPLYPKLAKQLESPFILTKVMDLPGFVIGEITDGNISKADGIAKILEHYNAEEFDAIGIGDSANDIPMLKKCGVGIAMGNSTPETKEAANYVTTDILKHGIWNAFVHYGIIEGEEK